MSKIVMGTSALVLTAAAVFAGRASVKSNVSTLFVSTAGGINCKQLTVVASSTFTTGGSGIQATLKTAGSATGAHMRVWAACSGGVGSHAIHFHG